ncbi:MAG: four helix bundle protein [Patescibacteria group bacterium]
MQIKSFKEILAWKKSHQLVLIIYKSIKYLPETEKYNLVSQMTRAAVSIPSNIAEGFARKGSSDSIKFYNIAQGSLEELKYQTLLCYDLKYFNKNQYNYLINLEDEVGKTLWGWIKSQISNKKDKN